MACTSSSAPKTSSSRCPGSSLIVAPFRDSERKVVGVLGVIGPTRLNYARIIPMVDFTARLVGRVLT